MAGLYLVQQESLGRDSVGGAIFLDRGGRTRLERREYVLQGIRQDEDVILLMTGQVARLTPSGESRWIVPCGAGPLGGGDILRMPGRDLIVLYFHTISDSGVEILRVSSEDGSVRWKSTCRPLGVIHSLYSYWATASLEGERIKVMSHASYGSFAEWLEAKSGKQLRRTEDRGRDE
jgi:hypothetical protein